LTHYLVLAFTFPISLTPLPFASLGQFWDYTSLESLYTAALTQAPISGKFKPGQFLSFFPKPVKMLNSALFWKISFLITCPSSKVAIRARHLFPS
jgi:hypothetical protein